MRLIGLNGRLHSGKDSAFEFIAEADTTVEVKRAAFADKLKLSAAVALGFTPQSVEEAVEICNQVKETGHVKTSYDTLSDTGNLMLAVKRISGREYLQLYGTEAHRDVFGTDFWVDALLPSPISGIPTVGMSVQRLYNAVLQEKFPDTEILVITDVRFANEAQRILDLDGEVWHIDAEERLGPLPDDAHPSERPLPDELLTKTVRNNDTLEDFQEAISWALNN